MKIGYLKQDVQERVRITQRGCIASWVRAWRLVDKDGVDLVQPWMDSKFEALNAARQLGIECREIHIWRSGIPV